MSENAWESVHSKDGRYFNPGVPPQKFLQLLKWMIGRKMGPWQVSYRLVAAPPPSGRVQGSDMKVTFVNHSTVLIQTAGRNILTDPIWSERTSPVSFLGPKRHRQPGIAFDDLPPIDIVLISHNHYDHLDVPTLRRVVARHAPAVFCPLGVAGLMRESGFGAISELDWWQSQACPEMRIHCVPAQHFSSRTPFDRNRTLWCGWMLEMEGGNVYFAGDTGFGDHFEAIGRRLAPIRLALLPIGAFKPEWFMGPIHMTPEQAVEAHGILKPQTSVAIHFGTFALADDGQMEPVDRLQRRLNSIHRPALIWVLTEGEGRSVPACD
jgi:L-ascorbate metabolism protein UlaG (beta-lactamase superfamily)